LALLRHYVLSLRKRFGGESAPLAWVRRSLANHVTLDVLQVYADAASALTSLHAPIMAALLGRPSIRIRTSRGIGATGIFKGLDDVF
jgi:hypothetical protein